MQLKYFNINWNAGFSRPSFIFDMFKDILNVNELTHQSIVVFGADCWRRRDTPNLPDLTPLLLNFTLDASEGRCARHLCNRRVEARCCRSNTRGRLSKSHHRRVVALHGSFSAHFLILLSNHLFLFIFSSIEIQQSSLSPAFSNTLY